MPAAAPIPPLPGDPKARLGIATGHDDNFGRFLVGTAPYMFEGTDLLDFSLPPDDQEPVSGCDVGRSIADRHLHPPLGRRAALVVGPSWTSTRWRT